MIRARLRAAHRALFPDVAELRREISVLEAEIVGVHRCNRELEEENTRLRALAGNLNPTPDEAILLDVVRANPGALAKDIGLAARKVRAEIARARFLAEYGNDGGSHSWWNREPYDGELADYTKPLTRMERKGLVRRERDGQTYRYWEVPRA